MSADTPPTSAATCDCGHGRSPGWMHNLNCPVSVRYWAKQEALKASTSAATDLVAPCPDCGFYRDTPNHVYGCNPRPEPGACGDPECYVLHRDPAHPIHPHERPHWHLITRHVHPEWHGHCDPDAPGYKLCDKPHWHFWWRHAHA